MRAASENPDVGIVPNAVASTDAQRRVRFHAGNAACSLGESRQVEPVSAADVDDVGAAPVHQVG